MWKCCGFELFSCWKLWFHEKNCQKKIGCKTRENVVVLDFLAVENFDFTRKIVKKNLGEKFLKMLGFCQNWIFGQKFDFSNSVWKALYTSRSHTFLNPFSSSMISVMNYLSLNHCLIFPTTEYSLIIMLDFLSMSFSSFFSLPCSATWSEFSRSPPPEPAPHDPALLAYKQQLLHVQGCQNQVITNQDQNSSQCNSASDAPLQNSLLHDHRIPLVYFCLVRFLILYYNFWTLFITIECFRINQKSCGWIIFYQLQKGNVNFSAIFLI